MGSHTLQAWASVFGGFLVHLTLGTIYSVGNMVPYVISYIRAYSHPQNVDYSDGTWIFALALVGQGTFMFVGGIINKKIGPRWTTFIGSSITSLGIVLTYFSIKVSFYLTVFTYGFVFGIGVGVAYAPPLACAMRWLPDKKGLVNGIVLAGFGGGAFVFSQIQTAFINPDNQAPDLIFGDEKYFSPLESEELLHRVPFTFLLMGGLFVILQTIGCMLLTSPGQQRFIYIQPTKVKEDKTCCYTDEQEPLIGGEEPIASVQRTTSLGDIEGEVKDTETEEEPDLYQSAPAALELKGEYNMAPDVHPLDMLRTRHFYTLWFLFLVNGQAVLFISSLYKAFGQTFINNDMFLTYVGAFASVFNATGRPMWGFLADRFGFRRTMLVLCTAMIIFMMTLILTQNGGQAMFFIWICAIFFIFSGNFALFPTVTAKTFGQKYVAVNFGLVFTSQIISGLIGALLTTSLEEHVGWFGMFGIVSGFSAVGWILALTYNFKRNGRDV